MGSEDDAKEPPKRQGIQTRCRRVPKRQRIWTRCRRAIEMIGDPDTMSENCRKNSGFRHDAGEPPKRQGIRGRCGIVVEKIGDLDTMSDIRRNDRGSGHDVEEPLTDLGFKQLKGRRGMPQYGVQEMLINDSNKQEIKHLNQYERRVYASVGRYSNIKDRGEAERKRVCPSLGYEYHVRKRGYAQV